MGLSALPRGSLHEATHNSSAGQRPIQLKASLSIVEFAHAFGVRAEELSREQFEYFLAARALLPLADSLGIPESRFQGHGSAPLSTRAEEGENADRIGRSNPTHSRVPSTDFTMGTARLRDLPYILPHQRCYPREQLVYMLANNQLIRRVMLHEQLLPEAPPCASEVEPRMGEESLHAQRAYLLLDVSQSMNGLVPLGGARPDKRGVIARGLSLAFLCVAEEQRSLLHFRPFSSSVGPRTSAASPTALRSLTQDILTIQNAGSTSLQSALDTAAADLHATSAKARVDVMLISDGVSHVSRNSLHGRHLHTFIVGGSATQHRNFAAVFENLTRWSTTFHHIADSDFSVLLEPRAGDLIALGDLLEQSVRNVPHFRSASQLEEAHNLISLGQACIELSGSHTELESYRERLQNLIKVASSELSSTQLRETIAAREREFQHMCLSYDKNLPEGFRTQTSAIDQGDNVASSRVSLEGARGGVPHKNGFLRLCRALYRRFEWWLRSLVGGGP